MPHNQLARNAQSRVGSSLRSSRKQAWFLFYSLFFYINIVQALFQNHKFKITHKEIIDVGTKLGYKNLEPGICYGFAMMYATAIMAKQEQLWLSSMALIESYKNDAGRLCYELQAVKNKLKSHQRLPAEQLALFNVPALYDGIELYHSPENHNDVFNRRFISQKDLTAIFKLARYGTLEESELSIVLDQTIAADVYLLNNYLCRLGDLLQHYAITLPFLLSSDCHALCLVYDHLARTWTLMDANNFGFSHNTRYKRNDIAFLVYNIFNGFNENIQGHSLMTIKGISTDNYANLNLLQLLKPMCIHDRVTAEMVSRVNRNGVDLLHMATKHGQFELVKAILKHHQDINQSSLIGGFPALMLASYFGYTEIVRLLLEHQANPNILSSRSDNISALHLACEAGHVDTTVLLLQYGADVNALDDHGMTAFTKALNNNHTDIMQLLLTHDANSHQDSKPFKSGEFLGTPRNSCGSKSLGLSAGFNGVEQSIYPNVIQLRFDAATVSTTDATKPQKQPAYYSLNRLRTLFFVPQKEPGVIQKKRFFTTQTAIDSEPANSTDHLSIKSTLIQ